MFQKLLTALFFFCSGVAFCQTPGNFTMTPKGNLNLNRVTLEVPAKFAGRVNANLTSTPFLLAPGYKVRVFHAGGLSKPRFLSWSPEGILHVADVSQGRVYALPDRNADGIADTAFVAASNCFGHDVKFYKGSMYVACENQILRYRDTNGDGIYETRSVFIDSILKGATFTSGGHSSRTILFDSVNRKMYLSIGSSCNVCREVGRAEIRQYNDDGTGGRTFATGTRNSVGLALHPVLGALFANNNGSDNQGNDVPPEWTDIVRDGGFYGHPFAYGYQKYFDFTRSSDYQRLLPLTAADSQKVAAVVYPAGLIQAHSAPMALRFGFDRPGLPAFYRNGLFMALRGSWNRNPATGAKLVFLSLGNDRDTTFDAVYDFFSGFLTDSTTSTGGSTGVYRGRPVGVEIDPAGNIYLSSDANNPFIAIIYPDKASGSVEPGPDATPLAVFPNPVRDVLHLGTACSQIQVFDLNGKLMLEIQDPVDLLDTGRLPAGAYLLRAKALQDGTSRFARFIKQ